MDEANLLRMTDTNTARWQLRQRARTNDEHKGQTMTIFLIDHRNGCGCEQVTADTAAEACEIYRAFLTPREGDYEMVARVADDNDSDSESKD